MKTLTTVLFSQRIVSYLAFLRTKGAGLLTPNLVTVLVFPLPWCSLTDSALLQVCLLQASLLGLLSLLLDSSCPFSLIFSFHRVPFSSHCSNVFSLVLKVSIIWYWGLPSPYPLPRSLSIPKSGCLPPAESWDLLSSSPDTSVPCVTLFIYFFIFLFFF